LRFSDFWERLQDQLGDAYADSFARDQVIEDLGLTIYQAFERGIETHQVWRAVAEREGWPQ